MTTKRPIATRPAPDRRRRRSGHDTTDPAHRERDHAQADARWLYAWSYDALRPTGELLAARLTTPPAFAPAESAASRLALDAATRPVERSHPIRRMTSGRC
jgi:hypothetical protein